MLLRGDPLADIRQTRRIELVITRGQVHTPSALIVNARQ